jgi:hypothetical protein
LETPAGDLDSHIGEPVYGLRTTAGDVEREAFSRRANAVEALGVMLFILVMLWPVGYYAGVLRGVPLADPFSNIALILGGVYLLFVAPFLHRDTLTSWGLGNPATVLRILSEGPRWKRAAFAAVLLALFLGLNYANYTNWSDVTRFFQLKGTLAADFDQGYPGRFVVFGFGSLLSAFIVLFAIRYDNFGSAFLTALKISLPLLAFVCLAAYMQRGAGAFTTLSPWDWAVGVFGYVFWGFVQQLLFSAYFGTRLRKAFAPPAAQARPHLVRWVLQAVLIGANIGLGAYVFALLGLRLAHGAPVEAVEVSLIVGIVGFCFGVVYGLYYGLNPKRMLVATLTASCFGLIHIDSYYLVAGTWALGIPLTYVFMEDKNRNLVALGFVHGLLGSTFGNLFSKGHSGVYEVDYSVGPYNIDFPTREVMIVPLLCIAVYVGILIWCWRNLSSEEPQEEIL